MLCVLFAVLQQIFWKWSSLNFVKDDKPWQNTNYIGTKIYLTRWGRVMHICVKKTNQAILPIYKFCVMLMFGWCAPGRLININSQDNLSYMKWNPISGHLKTFFYTKYIFCIYLPVFKM